MNTSLLRKTGNRTGGKNANEAQDENLRGEEKEMRKLRILFSTPHSGLQTGSGIQLYLLARELIRRGHQVCAAFKNKVGGSEEPDPTLKKLEAAGVKVIRVPFAKLKYWFTLPALLELGAYLFEQEFDIVHCFAGMDLNYFFLLSWFVPLGAIIANRGTFEPLDIFNSIKYRTGRIKRILAVSEAVKTSLVKSGWVPADKIEVSYSAADLSWFDPELDDRPVRAELGLSPDDQVIGAIGSFRFSPGHLKGGMELLAAARLILEKHPCTRFLLVGGINRELFLQAAEKLGIADRFTLTGFREDVPRLLAACDLTLVPSIYAEGLNGTIREALAMKKPVVATDVGGNSELVLNGVTGRLVPPADPSALAAAACELLEQPALRTAMGEAGRKKVEACCSLAAKAERIEKIYYESLPPDLKSPRPRSWQLGIHRIHRATSSIFKDGPRLLQGWQPRPQVIAEESRRSPF